MKKHPLITLSIGVRLTNYQAEQLSFDTTKATLTFDLNSKYNLL